MDSNLKPYNVSVLLDAYCRYLKNDSNIRIHEFLGLLNDNLKKAEQDEIKEKFNRLVSQTITDNKDTYDFVVTINNRGKYDIWLVYDCTFYLHRLNSDEMISKLTLNNVECYVITDFNLDDVKKFIKALYIYKIISNTAKTRDDCKDLTTDSGKIWEFKCEERLLLSVYDRNLNYAIFPFEVYSSEEISHWNLEGYGYIDSMHAALEVVYKNEFIGTSIKKLELNK